MTEARKAVAAMLPALRDAADQLQAIQDDLQAAYDDKSERWQESERGENAMTDITNLEEAIGLLEDATCLLEGFAQ